MQFPGSQDLKNRTHIDPEVIAYTPEDAGRICGVGAARILKLIHDGTLAAKMKGTRRYLIERAELERWVRSLPTKA